VHANLRNSMFTPLNVEHEAFCAVARGTKPAHVASARATGASTPLSSSKQRHDSLTARTPPPATSSSVADLTSLGNSSNNAINNDGGNNNSISDANGESLLLDGRVRSNSDGAKLVGDVEFDTAMEFDLRNERCTSVFSK
jgi:hypothetical protein